mgnify:FL=1
MRTGTKFAGFLILWATSLITALIIWLISIGDNPIADKVWSNLSAIITAILGPPGLGLTVNEARKAIESGGLAEIVQKFKKKGDEQ